MGEKKDIFVYLGLGFILFVAIFVMALVHYEPSRENTREISIVDNFIVDPDDADDFFDSFFDDKTKKEGPDKGASDIPALDDIPPYTLRVLVKDENGASVGGLECRVFLPDKNEQLLEVSNMNEKDECIFFLERKIRYKIEVPLDTNVFTKNSAWVFYRHESMDGEARRVINVNLRPENDEECIDSDGGINKEVKGKTVGFNNQGVRMDKEDYCYNLPKNAIELYEGEYVADYYCAKNTHLSYYKTDIDNLVFFGRNIKCPNGCRDGACVADVSKAEEQRDCVDSDGGRNYYYPGTVTNKKDNSELITYKDECQGDMVNEFFCPTNENEKYFINKMYKCPYGCKEGVCLYSCNNDKNVMCDNEEAEGVPDFKTMLLFNDSEYLYINIGFFGGPTAVQGFNKFIVYFKDKHRTSASKIDVYPDRFKLYWSKEPKSGYYGEFKYSGKSTIISNKVMIKIPVNLILENNPERTEVWLYSIESKDRVPDSGQFEYVKTY